MAGEQEISWTVQTHEHKERSVDWYWILGTIALAGAGLSAFLGNVLLAAIILLGAFSIAMLAARGPREHMVKLSERGLTVDGTRYPYDAIHSFWVEHEREQPRLFITMNGILSPHFSFLLNDAAHGEQVRSFLQRFAKEEEQGPHLGDHLAEIFGL